MSGQNIAEDATLQGESANLEAALTLIRSGFKVFPCTPDKRPRVKAWGQVATGNAAQIRAWWARWPDAMPGLPTGAANGLTVVDLDRGHASGADGVAAWADLGLPDGAVIIETPSGGQHHWFCHGGEKNTAGEIAPGVDTRGEGGYVIAPGAVLPDGRTYRLSKGELSFAGFGLLPDMPDLPLLARAADANPTAPADRSGDQAARIIALARLAAAAEAMADAEDGTRNGTLNRLSHEMGQLAACNLLSNAEIMDALLDGAAGLISDDGLAQCRKTIRSGLRAGRLDPNPPVTAASFEDSPAVTSGGDPRPSEVGKYAPDEDGAIRAFADRHAHEMRFDHQQGQWFRFDGNAWRPEATQLAADFTRKLAVTMGRRDPKAKALLKVSTAESVERGARRDRAFAVDSSIWNRDQYLLGTPGGTVDLRTGVLRPGRADDHISRVAAAAPVSLDGFCPELDCPNWLAFLQQALGGDGDAIRFFAQWCGYGLTGDTREHALLFVYGPGGSGKSTAVNTIAELMGDYSINVASSTLTATRHEAHKEEIARLDGPRFAWASETEKGSRWAENRIKELTGGDPITARHMRQNSFTFTPRAKFTVIGNNAPALADVDSAIRRRFMILPFDHPPEQRDTMLPEKLRGELPGILAWAIRGALDWQKHGLVRPDVVQRATQNYFEGQDTFAQWLDQCCETGPECADSAARLWESWSRFARMEGAEPGNRQRDFPVALEKHGFKRMKDCGGVRGRGYRGLQVATLATQVFDDE